MSLPVVQDDSPGGGGGGGDTLIFSHIRRLSLILGVQNSKFQYFLGFQKKTNIFWGGMKILWIFFWGHHKIGLAPQL